MRTIFLSRATNEFAPMVNPLRQVAEHQYPLLEVTDQLFPPSPNHRLEAKETVSRLREWLTKVDAVVHFVGQRAGAVCKVPEGDFDGILNFLNPPTRKLFEELATFFEANGISRDAITYTHFEGAVGLLALAHMVEVAMHIPVPGLFETCFVICIGGPALIAAMHGFASQMEVDRLQIRSSSMARLLKERRTAVDAIDLSKPDDVKTSWILAAEALTTTEMLMDEVAGWSLLYRNTGIHAG